MVLGVCMLFFFFLIVSLQPREIALIIHIFVKEGLEKGIEFLGLILGGSGIAACQPVLPSCRLVLLCDHPSNLQSPDDGTQLCYWQPYVLKS